jgi:hypothetical protein
MDRLSISDLLAERGKTSALRFARTASLEEVR